MYIYIFCFLSVRFALRLRRNLFIFTVCFGIRQCASVVLVCD